MTLRLATAALVALSLAGALPAQAQTTRKTEVSRDVSMNGGVATRTVKVTHVTKHKTRRPKRILGVKVGHKTITHKVVRKTSVSSDGRRSTSVTRK